jgi:hypothetical protein
MIEEQSILVAERLRDDLSDLLQQLRARYPSKTNQVASGNLRRTAARLSEIWLIEFATNTDVTLALGSTVLADLNVNFQRILTFSEHATTRSRYDVEIRSILRDYATKVVLPLKQSKGRHVLSPLTQVKPVMHSAFVGQSFMTNDRQVNTCVVQTLEALGLSVVTGEKPRADQISEKVKRLIEEQSIFVGVFTRRDKIARKAEWTTSNWVIDEKAYALGRKKPLVLIKEHGVGSIGGIQGDYEYIEFSRESLELLPVRLFQLFEVTNTGLRS